MYLGQTWQIYQSQIEDVRRVDLEIDRLSIDAFVVARYPGGFILNFAFDIGEVAESAVWDMMELGPFRPSSLRGRSIRIGRLWGRVVLRHIDKLQDKRAPCNDATSAGQEVTTNDIL